MSLPVRTVISIRTSIISVLVKLSCDLISSQHSLNVLVCHQQCGNMSADVLELEGPAYLTRSSVTDDGVAISLLTRRNHEPLTAVFQVAIKSIAKKKVTSEQDLTRIRREIEIMASLSHKHIIQIYEGESRVALAADACVEGAVLRRGV